MAKACYVYLFYAISGFGECDTVFYRPSLVQAKLLNILSV